MVKLTDIEFLEIVEFMKKYYGINLTGKRLLIEGRLQSVLARKNFQSFSEYYSYISEDIKGKALKEMLNKITTNYTFFMREEQHFYYFKNVVLPYLYEKRIKDKDLRIWSAGCSTGEEAYTIAMIMSDFFKDEKLLWDTKILATDISYSVIEKAKRGIYDNEKVKRLPTKWQNNYFNKIDLDKSIIAEKLKKDVLFRIFNLNNNRFPFKKRFDVIFCRNVMIYFDEYTKRDLIKKLYEYTEVGGYLFIGHSESLNLKYTNYKYIMPSVYRKE